MKKSQHQKRADKAAKDAKKSCDLWESSISKKVACGLGVEFGRDVYASGFYTSEQVWPEAIKDCLRLLNDKTSELVACRSGVRKFVRSLRVDVLHLPPLDLAGARRRKA